MRIGELSRRTGVSVPTIKFYVREGLLPPGRLSSPNQAHYDEGHERRLRLIRTLIGVGGLSVAAVADVLAAIDDPSQPVHKVLGVASTSIAGQGTDDGGAGGKARSGAGDGSGDGSGDGTDGSGNGERTAAVRAEVEALLARRGWRVSPHYPAVDSLVTAVAAMERLGHGDLVRLLDAYADAVEIIARADVEYVAERADRDGLVETVVVGTLLGDKIIAALRRIAQVDASARRFGD
ncbi:MerR family transcriptional regulator [Streptomyces macrosporus]|uniref:MerR family transcriptional regulator n=1 Tax=Streptomyces macrosporus TaxID=44032 RepID=A0ABN3JNC8_9ACTN